MLFFLHPAISVLSDESNDPQHAMSSESTEMHENEESARAKIHWQEIGQVDNMMIAGLAKEMLESEGIPVVVMSQAGFLGELGLPLQNMFTGGPSRTRLLVPEESADDATALMFETMGEMWYPSAFSSSTKPTDQENAS